MLNWQTNFRSGALFCWNFNQVSNGGVFLNNCNAVICILLLLIFYWQLLEHTYNIKQLIVLLTHTYTKGALWSMFCNSLGCQLDLCVETASVHHKLFIWFLVGLNVQSSSVVFSVLVIKVVHFIYSHIVLFSGILLST